MEKKINSVYILALILVIAFAVRLIYWNFIARDLFDIKNDHGDARFYYYSAHSMAEKFSYELNGEPTAKKPPMYTLFSGLILKLFKEDNSVFIVQYIFGVLSALPLFFILRCYIKTSVSIIIITAYLFYPTSWYWESQFMSECVYVWITNLFIYFFHKYIRENRYIWLISGVFFGAIAFLTKPAAIFILSFIFLGVVWKKKLFTIVIIGLLWCTTFSIAIAPWIWRNYNVFGHFIPTSTSGGVTLYTSYINWGRDMSIVNILPGDMDILKKLDSEYAVDKYLMAQSLDFLKKKPYKIVTLAPYKIKDYLHPFHGRWYPISYYSKVNPYYFFLLILTLLGILWNRREKSAIWKLSILIIAGGIASAILFHGEIRYGYTLSPVFFLLSGLCFSSKALENKRKMKIIQLSTLGTTIIWILGMWIS